MLHYVGGKPWQSKDELEKNDWEGGEAYKSLFQLWWQIRNGEIFLASDKVTYMQMRDGVLTNIGSCLSKIVPLAITT